MKLQRIHITRNSWKSPSVKGPFYYDVMLSPEAICIFYGDFME